MDGRGEDAELEVHELLDGVARAYRECDAVSGSVHGGLRGTSCRLRSWMAKHSRKRFAGRSPSDTAALVAETGVVPGLTVVLVGEDPASQVYVRNKAAACKAAGMNGRVLRLPASTSQAELLSTIDRLNADPAVHGILVQLPLPRQIDESIVVEASRSAEGRRWLSSRQLRAAGGGNASIRSLHAAGHSRAACSRPRSRPAGPTPSFWAGRASWAGRWRFCCFRKAQGETRPSRSATPQLVTPPHFARQADLLFVAMGQPELVTADWIKPGAVVIDVGMHKRADGRLCGDVHFESVSRVASHITPVPGGVGPMTIAMLLKNTLQAARMAVAAGSS